MIAPEQDVRHEEIPALSPSIPKGTSVYITQMNPKTGDVIETPLLEKQSCKCPSLTIGERFAVSYYVKNPVGVFSVSFHKIQRVIPEANGAYVYLENNQLFHIEKVPDPEPVASGIQKTRRHFLLFFA